MHIIVNPAKCVGCRLCELACSFIKTGKFNPKVSRIRIVTSYPALIDYPVVCIQCESSPCINVCPMGALNKDKKTGAIILDEEKCTGCKLCAMECPYSAINFNEKIKKPIICDLCGGEPECVKWCYFDAIKLDNK